MKFITLIIISMVLYGTLHRKANAEELTYTNKKDIHDGIKRTCIKSQKADPLNASIPVWKIEEYCDCSGLAMSQRLTFEELKYFQTNGTWPNGFEAKAREEGFKCIEQLTKKWNGK
jgi:hypothetical protein